MNPIEEALASETLDPDIAEAVRRLAAAGIETFESCQGGSGHSYPEPTIRFYGDRSEGFRALAAALQFGLPVYALRRTWPIIDGDPTGPHWELTLKAPGHEGQERLQSVAVANQVGADHSSSLSCMASRGARPASRRLECCGCRGACLRLRRGRLAMTCHAARGAIG